MKWYLKYGVLCCTLITLLFSCGKDETTVVDYEPITIAGRWNVTGYYSNSLQAVQNYPNVLDSTIVNFSDTGRVSVKGACTVATAYYLQTQTKELLVTELNGVALFCNQLANETQSIIFNSFQSAYSFDLNGNELIIRSSNVSTPYLYLRQIP